MSSSRLPIWIVDGSTGEPCDAILFDKIGENHLRDFEESWRPWLLNTLAADPKLPRPQTAHWVGKQNR